MTWFKKLLPKNTFSRGVSVLVGGTAGAQALMILASPLLTRLYTPEDFGLLAVYSALLALFAVVASLRYELAIPLPESNTEAANVLILSLLAVLLMTLISAVMILVAGEQIASALDTPKLKNYFWLLPLGVLLSGIYNVFSYWAVRTKNFGDISRTRVSQTLTTLVVQLLGFKLGSIVLLFGQASGQGVGSFRLARSALKDEEFSNWTWNGVVVVAKRYKQFPIFSTWSGLFNTAGTQLPPLIFAAFFSASSAGLYALANRMLQIPMSVIGGAISKVYFSDLAEAKINGQLSRKIEDGADALIKLSFPGGVIFMLYAPEIFFWIFGSEWKVAGDAARWMVPWILLQFVSSPLSVVYFVMEKEKLGLLFQITMVITRVISLFIGYFYFDFMTSIVFFSISSSICYFIYSLSIFSISGLCVNVFLFKVIIELSKVLPMMLVIVVAQQFSFMSGLIMSFCILSIFYFLRLNRFYKNGFS